MPSQMGSVVTRPGKNDPGSLRPARERLVPSPSLALAGVAPCHHFIWGLQRSLHRSNSSRSSSKTRTGPAANAVVSRRVPRSWSKKTDVGKGPDLNPAQLNPSRTIWQSLWGRKFEKSGCWLESLKSLDLAAAWRPSHPVSSHHLLGPSSLDLSLGTVTRDSFC